MRADLFVVSAEDIRRSLRAFNAQAMEHRARAERLLLQTTYWVYDPDADQFGPGKFVGLAGITFAAYERRLHEVTGSETRAAIERALDDLFDSRPRWRRRLRAWGEALVGEKAFGNAREEKWRFTSLRAKAGRSAMVLTAEEDLAAFPEGEVAFVQHVRRERSAALVRAKKRQALHRFGKLACEVCGFDFREQYGSVGSGYIECHHTISVSELKPGAVTKLEDVVLVCSNCHRMIHRKRPWLDVQKIRSLLQTE